MLSKILADEKTVTRRPVKYNKSGKYLPARYKVDGGPGGTYALQGPPEKGSKARARTIPGYRLRIVSVEMERVGEVTDEEARLEGLEDRFAYWRYWLKELYGKLDFKQKVWRYEFELVEVGS
jgi:hypothetical protein